MAEKVVVWDLLSVVVEMFVCVCGIYVAVVMTVG